MAKIEVRIERLRTGYSAYAEQYASFTTGRTLEELRFNMVESLNLLFEGQRVVTVSDLAFADFETWHNTR